MPKERNSTRKISIDLPLDLWARYQDLGESYGMKIKDFVLGAFQAVDFFDKFLSETLTEQQIREISPLLIQSLQKYERLYCGSTRSRNLDKKNVIYFDKNNSLRTDPELAIRTHDIVQEFYEHDAWAEDVMDEKRKKARQIAQQIILR